MQSAEMASFTVHANGNVSIVFSDGAGVDFGSLTACKNWALGLEDSDPDLAKKLLVAWWSARNPALSNTSLVIGKKLTFDLTSPSPIKVQ